MQIITELDYVIIDTGYSSRINLKELEKGLDCDDYAEEEDISIARKEKYQKLVNIGVILIAYRDYPHSYVKKWLTEETDEIASLLDALGNDQEGLIVRVSCVANAFYIADTIREKNISHCVLFNIDQLKYLTFGNDKKALVISFDSESG